MSLEHHPVKSNRSCSARLPGRHDGVRRTFNPRLAVRLPDNPQATWRQTRTRTGWLTFVLPLVKTRC